jgi:hypothetical protein
MDGRIGLFDMDGTLFDYDGQLRKDLRLLMAPGEVEAENIFDESKPWLKARMHLIKSVPGWWRNLPKFQLGWDVYNIADNMGFCIEILTKGPRSKPQAWAEKVECINQHFGEDMVPNIVGKDKKRYYGRFLVDDYPQYVADWLKHRPRGLVIMPAHDYNTPEKFHKAVEDEYEPFQITELLDNVIRYDGTNLEEVRKALMAVWNRESGQHWREYL